LTSKKGLYSIESVSQSVSSNFCQTNEAGTEQAALIAQDQMPSERQQICQVVVRVWTDSWNGSVSDWSERGVELSQSHSVSEWLNRLPNHDAIQLLS